ncbi:DUF3253 domain-containing protein [Mycobacterium sp. SMC-8]|uniref:DUF3253 domain-containing protein n=1 Tax=Mycobacterium sp. SMC-8 TaxID=2857060 RepID=UPI0021B48A30|nr:DUF3253 domain-containing protein [Mycobacterium sp. SMC-8]UXA11020.1 DUF3253 domain-containing protein [Mycobacterium sp. SMC-8]
MAEQRRAELERIAGGGGPGAARARLALGDAPIRQRLRAGILALAAHRGPGSSTCPSDAARAVGGARWRDVMVDARDLARELARAGKVEITQRGEVLDPDGEWRGPIRIRIRP